MMKGKGNDGKGDVPERDLWRTQQKLFNLLDRQYSFTFDCCANEDNKKCIDFTNDFLSIQEEYLEDSRCWMNPPFSKANQMFKHFFKVVKEGVAIFRCDNMETKIWQEQILKNAHWIFIFKGRVNYTPFNIRNIQKGNRSRFPSALIGIGVNVPIGIDGKILFTKTEGNTQ
jgi:phage N-6-adenine-methyltransferase